MRRVRSSLTSHVGHTEACCLLALCGRTHSWAPDRARSRSNELSHRQKHKHKTQTYWDLYNLGCPSNTLEGRRICAMSSRSCYMIHGTCSMNMTCETKIQMTCSLGTTFCCGHPRMYISRYHVCLIELNTQDTYLTYRLSLSCKVFNFRCWQLVNMHSGNRDSRPLGSFIAEKDTLKMLYKTLV